MEVEPSVIECFIELTPEKPIAGWQLKPGAYGIHRAHRVLRNGAANPPHKTENREIIRPPIADLKKNENDKVAKTASPQPPPIAEPEIVTESKKEEKV